jgi:hypothetical protein
VNVIELRMWMPLWSDKTAAVSHILPMAVNSGLSCLVLTPDVVEIVTEPRMKSRPRQTVNYCEAAMFRRAIRYRGGAIVVDDISASF